ncbi:hypothetical protein MNB_SV-14-1042 [hydrothermal vent metagenome]|uniref:Uncharacterized protein n=1 Tax=hydrothermal vent metagenome TaxID=652676 RepID=A0A1W1CCX3_9ZZZZ
MQTTIIYHSDNGTAYIETETVNFIPPIGSSLINSDYKDNTNEQGLYVVTDVQIEKTPTGYTAKAYAHTVDPDVLNRAMDKLHDFFTI